MSNNKVKFVTESKSDSTMKTAPPLNICYVINVLYYLKPFSKIIILSEPLDKIGSEIERASFLSLKNILLQLDSGKNDPINIYPFLDKFCNFTNSNFHTFEELDVAFVWDNIIRLITVVIPPLREVFLGKISSSLDVPGWMNLISRCFHAQFNHPIQSLEELIRSTLNDDKSENEDTHQMDRIRTFNAKMLQRAPEILVFAVESTHLPVSLRFAETFNSAKASSNKPKPCTAIRFPQNFDLAALSPQKESSTTSSSSESNTNNNNSSKLYALSAVISLEGAQFDSVQAYYCGYDETQNIPKWFKGTGSQHEEVDKVKAIDRNYFNVNDTKKVHPRLLIYVKKGILQVLDRLADYVSKAGQMRSLGDASFETAETPEHYDEAKHYYEEALAYDESLRPILQERLHALEQIEKNQKAQSYENQADVCLGKRRFKEACDLYKMAMRSAVVNSPLYVRIREKEDYVMKIISLEIANHLSEKGEDCLKSGQFSQGKEHFAQALRLNPEYIHLQSIINGIDKSITTQSSASKVMEANQAMKVGKYKYANQLFIEAIALVPERGNALKPVLESLVILMQGEDALMKQRSGLIALEDKKYQLAISLITEAISLLPGESIMEHAFFLCDRAQVYFEMKDYQTSVKDCNAALELKPELATAYLRLGMAQFELEQYDEALTNYEKAMRYDNTLNEQVKVKIRQVNTAKEVLQRKEREAERERQKEEARLQLEAKKVRDEQLRKEKQEKLAQEQAEKAERQRLKEEEKRMKALQAKELEDANNRDKEAEKERLRQEKIEKEQEKKAEKERLKQAKEQERERAKQLKEAKALEEKRIHDEELRKQKEFAAEIERAEAKLKEAEKEKEAQAEKARIERERIIAEREKARQDKLNDPSNKKKADSKGDTPHSTSSVANTPKNTTVPSSSSSANNVSTPLSYSATAAAAITVTSNTPTITAASLDPFPSLSTSTNNKDKSSLVSGVGTGTPVTASWNANSNNVIAGKGNNNKESKWAAPSPKDSKTPNNNTLTTPSSGNNTMFNGKKTPSGILPRPNSGGDFPPLGDNGNNNIANSPHSHPPLQMPILSNNNNSATKATPSYSSIKSEIELGAKISLAMQEQEQARLEAAADRLSILEMARNTTSGGLNSNNNMLGSGLLGSNSNNNSNSFNFPDALGGLGVSNNNTSNNNNNTTTSSLDPSGVGISPLFSRLGFNASGSQDNLLSRASSGGNSTHSNNNTSNLLSGIGVGGGNSLGYDAFGNNSNNSNNNMNNININSNSNSFGLFGSSALGNTSNHSLHSLNATNSNNVASSGLYKSNLAELGGGNSFNNNNNSNIGNSGNDYSSHYDLSDTHLTSGNNINNLTSNNNNSNNAGFHLNFNYDDDGPLGLSLNSANTNNNRLTPSQLSSRSNISNTNNNNFLSSILGGGNSNSKSGYDNNNNNHNNHTSGISGLGGIPLHTGSDDLMGLNVLGSGNNNNNNDLYGDSMYSNLLSSSLTDDLNLGGGFGSKLLNNNNNKFSSLDGVGVGSDSLNLLAQNSGGLNAFASEFKMNRLPSPPGIQSAPGLGGGNNNNNIINNKGPPALSLNRDTSNNINNNTLAGILGGGGGITPGGSGIAFNSALGGLNGFGSGVSGGSSLLAGLNSSSTTLLGNNNNLNLHASNNITSSFSGQNNQGNSPVNSNNSSNNNNNGIDGDMLSENIYPSVAWLRNYNMHMYRWSGDEREWIEFAMHIPRYNTSPYGNDAIYQLIVGHNPNDMNDITKLNEISRRSGCKMWLDEEILQGSNEKFIIFYRGSSGQPSNHAMQNALEIISDLMKGFVASLPANNTPNKSIGSSSNNNANSPNNNANVPKLDLLSGILTGSSDTGSLLSLTGTSPTTIPTSPRVIKQRPPLLKIASSNTGYVQRLIEVPRDVVGLVIGQSGKKIKELCTASGAKIQFRVNKTAEREGRPGMLEVQGSADNVDKGMQLIWELLQFLGKEYNEVPYVPFSRTK